MPAFLVYGVVLLFMSVSALACFMANTLAGVLIACGGALCVSKAGPFPCRIGYGKIKKPRRRETALIRAGVLALV